jgi:hypothetical protein
MTGAERIAKYRAEHLRPVTKLVPKTHPENDM